MKKPEEERERLQREELRRNPGGAFNNGLIRAIVGSSSGLGLQFTGIIIIMLLIIICILAFF
ncbi:DUF6366 family protein [Sutcliffiella rhizosphaerae]|uniref:DUF4190 domain-containing protein n=1 Tax=Sutcliffiella rhizosphaerae TaxID=2880967 RepID=A0ABM8YNQ3_9BACI|nr:DUF6366 family protein [Sutcliffiella rhizosphaerae]CAG9621605.1 hypothetical protein BACCIP111883_02378 [Sutcliffiella rhizosphaerae]